MQHLDYVLTCVVNASDQSDLDRLIKSMEDGRERSEIQFLIVSPSENTIVENKAENFHYYKEDTSDTLAAYQTVKQDIAGEYVCFLNDSMFYDGDSFKSVIDKLKKKNEKICCVVPYHQDQYGVRNIYTGCTESEGKVSVVPSLMGMNLYFSSYFMKREVFSKIEFNEDIRTEKTMDFLVSLILKYQSIYFVKGCRLIYTRAAEDNFSTSFQQYDQDWYMHDLKAYLLPLAKKSAGLDPNKRDFVQITVLYLLFMRFYCNYNDRTKKVLSDESLQMFFSSAGQILSYLDNFIIFQKKKLFKYTIPRPLKLLFIKLKYETLGTDYKIKEDGRCLYLASESGASEEIERIVRFATFTNEKAEIMAMNYEAGCMELDVKCYLTDYFKEEDIKIKVLSDGKEVPYTQTGCYSYIKCFGKSILKHYQFHVSIPIRNLGKKESQHIFFYMLVNGEAHQMHPVYKTAASRLSSKFERSYWRMGDFFVIRTRSKSIKIVRADFRTFLKRELVFIRSILKTSKTAEDRRDAIRFIWLRMAYHVLRPLYKKKRIWVSFDKLYKGGDNGEYMYHYLKDKQSEITPYYIINRDSPDYERLKQSGEKILITNSAKCRRICLLAEAILATHSTIWTYCGFNAVERNYVKDLFQAKLICIQHGLTVQKIAQYQNRLFDNTQFYCCASKYEVDNIMQPIFGYESRNVVLTGLARYDGLKNNDQKQILITPTWRRDIVNNGIACIKKSYNEHFKESTYFKIYNSLLNDKTLIETAKKCGYHIIFLLHPAMSAQSEDYDRNDYVSIVEAAGDMSYEKILTESSLMVTDYSGVQFDFAYMRKPVIYYHPEELPPFYEEGVFQYDTMGFGEICTTRESIVNTICGYMRNQCRPRDLYMERADDFFAYDDYNSCERIYKSVLEYLKRK